ncbi:helix-turn-helix domain-containing protein [Paenibacillus sp. YN15]|uniref:helix-turn-helix domain-containing protein n=1 Tax=Paenibacillus sp. YN15 TaxID=1742774 RepID=UPI000DCE492E|nr:helix-turn-helix domain-containing protein [Paenibacillus sp. YN15]RAV04131.1 hypothetical protein DQG13_06550 [Paenibacillus sp. YN15]
MPKWRSKGVRLQWLYSYLLVLLIPVVAVMGIYSKTRQLIESEISRANSALLAQLQQEFDANIDYCFSLTEMITLNSKLSSLIRNQETIGVQERLGISQLLTDLRAYSLPRSTGASLYIYFPKGEFVLNEKAYYTADIFHQSYLEPAGVGIDRWKGFLQSGLRGFFTSQESYGGGPDKGIMYVHYLTDQFRGGSTAVLVIQLDQERLLSSLQHIQSYNQGEVLILDEQDRILASSGNPGRNYSGIPFESAFRQESGVAKLKLDGEDIVLSYTQSAKTNWKYIYVLPANIYSEKAEYAGKITYFAIIAALIVGLLLALMMTRRHYHPLARLIKSANSHHKRELAEVSLSNEFDYLEEVLDQVWESNTAMNEALEKQKTTLRSHLLVRILKGRLEQGFPADAVLPEHGIKPLSDQYAVLLIYLEDYSGFFLSHEQDEEKNRRLVQLIIANIVEELTEKEHQGWVTEIDNMMACLLNFSGSSSPEAAMEDMRTIAEEALRFIGDRFHIHFTVSASDIHRSLANVPQAYHEALHAMQYRMIMGTRIFIGYGQTQHEHSSYSYPLDQEQQLSNLIQAGEAGSAREMLERIIAENLSRPGISADMIRCLLFDISSTMMKAAMESGLENDGLFADNLHILKALVNGATVMETRQRLSEFLDQLCKLAEERKKKGKHRLKENVIAYIADNYQEQHLSVNSISEHFGVHPSYLSRYFKEQTGDMLSEYISRCRIEQSKLLLLQDDMLIKEISDRVGIFSVTTFVRLFKKYEGVTPSTYKENRRSLR